MSDKSKIEFTEAMYRIATIGPRRENMNKEFWLSNNAPTCVVMTITPAIARELLLRNTLNRNIKRKAVDCYARDMLAGKFQLNGSTIVIDTNGTLVDGQHRLYACIQADTPFQSYVMTGARPDVRTTIDSGVGRSHGDRLAMQGKKNAYATAAVARLLMRIAEGKPDSYKPTPQELDDFLNLHSQIPESVARIKGVLLKLGTVLACLHYIGTYNNLQDRADSMIDVWKKGLPDYEGCPMHLVRERIVRRQGTPTELTSDIKMKLVFAAWGPFAKYQAVKIIRPLQKPFLPEYWKASDLKFQTK